MLKRITALILALAMMLTLASFGSISMAEEAVEPGEVKDTIKIALPKNITSMDGSKGGNNSFNALWQIFDMLVEMDENSQLQPKLATAWEMVDDYTWRFTLREGVKFHDGSDFTAEDAKASIDRIVNMSPTYFYAANWVDAWPPEVEIENDFSILVKTPVMNLKTPEMLSRVIMHPAEYDQVENFFSEALIGTGAYKFISWEAGVGIKMEAFDGYWDGAPAVKYLEYDFVTDSSARLTAFQNGEYDIAFDIPYSNIELLKNKGFRVDTKDLIGVSMIYFNPMNFENGTVISDARIRQAMSYAIDSYGIVDAIMYGYGTVVQGAANHLAVGASNGEGLPERDIEKAKQLMSEAGYAGQEINFFYVNGEFNNALEISELIVAELQEVGFNVKFTEVEPGLWESDYKGKAGWDICVNNVPGTFSGDADYYWLHCLKNKIGWRSEEVDKYMSAAYASRTIEERTANFKLAMDEVWKLWPYLWAVETMGIYGVTKNIAGIEYVELGVLHLRDAYYVG